MKVTCDTRSVDIVDLRCVMTKGDAETLERALKRSIDHMVFPPDEFRALEKIWLQIPNKEKRNEPMSDPGHTSAPADAGDSTTTDSGSGSAGGDEVCPAEDGFPVDVIAKLEADFRQARHISPYHPLRWQYTMGINACEMLLAVFAKLHSITFGPFTDQCPSAAPTTVEDGLRALAEKCNLELCKRQLMGERPEHTLAYLSKDIPPESGGKVHSPDEFRPLGVDHPCGHPQHWLHGIQNLTPIGLDNEGCADKPAGTDTPPEPYSPHDD